jgi:uncharacterized membrane protein YebE (DUF533 family)
MKSSNDDGAFLAVIRVWAAAAWADGRLVEAEAEAMRRLVAVAPVGDAARATALGYLGARVELDTAELGGLTLDQRRGIYRAAVRLARVDRVVAPEETAFLGRLREGLGLDEAAAAAIEATLA